MATNYGYVRRDPEDRINWADVGTDISNKLKDEIERRDTLKQSIKDESQKFDEKIFTLPETDNNLLKTEALNFANIVSQQRLSQDRRLQDGSLSLRDYTVERQNLGNTQQLMSQFTKDKVKYDTEFAKLYAEGKLSAQSGSDRAQNERYSNLTQYGLQVDEYGNGFMAKKDGQGGFDPNDTLGLRSMVANNARLIAMPDVKKIIESGVGFAAKEYTIANVDGLKSVDDAWQNENFVKSIGDYLNAQLVNPDATSAILGTYLTGYEYEYLGGTIGGEKNPKGKGGNSIPLRRNSRGVWEFDQESAQGKKLRQVVADKLLQQVRGKMDRKETDFSVSEKISRNKNFEEGRSENESIIQTGKLFNGNEQEIKDALVYFEGKNGVKYNLLSTDGSTLTLSSTDKEGNVTEFVLDRKKGMTPISFLTQASTQFGGFDLGKAKNSDAFKSWALDTNGAMTSPSLVSEEIQFGGTNTTPAKFNETLDTRMILGDDNKLAPALDKFKKSFKNDKPSAIENELIEFGFTDVSIEEIENSSYGPDYIKINVPGQTSMPLLVAKTVPESQILKLISKIENNKKLNKKPITQNEVNKLINGTNIIKTVYGTILGLEGTELEEQWNGGDGVPSTSTVNSNSPNSTINGAQYND